ncbi:transposase [Acidithrix ferrooxidans]|uniref:transposase n=1 Tax=Acidithrix ferrooxidans TaxID=1280514 RepID=UPI00190F63FD
MDSATFIPEVASELSISQEALYRWVKDERIRLEAASSVSEGPLSADERRELIKLRREMAELKKDNEFLGKAAAYFAAKQANEGDLP